VDERKIIEKKSESEGKTVIRRQSDGRKFSINFIYKNIANITINCG